MQWLGAQLFRPSCRRDRARFWRRRPIVVRVRLARAPVLLSYFPNAQCGGPSLPERSDRVTEHSMPPERRSTGIPGLDRLLEGGLLVPGVYISKGLRAQAKPFWPIRRASITHQRVATPYM